METFWSFGIGLTEAGWAPDFLVRMGMRSLIAQRLEQFRKNGVEQQQRIEDAFVDQLKTQPIAIKTADANEQHYEVPTKLYQLCLGPRLKYSSCYYKTPKDTLAQAENNMFAMYCERAKIEDGMSILDCGCGWGSLSLYLAEHYPNCTIYSISNSSTQKLYIDQVAKSKGFKNVNVFTCDINNFDYLTHDLKNGETRAPLDRVMSVEMFEHMKNYDLLLEHISSWLKPTGLLFVHIFVFAHHSYHFEVQSASDWMTKYFFEGGTMPHVSLLARFQRSMHLKQQWSVKGTHYSRTLEDWLQLFDANRAKLMPVLAATYGAEDAVKWFSRWRMFFMASSELFGYDQGNQWYVAHYLFQPHAAKK